MPKYRLLRDCPHGKAGSMWHDRRDLYTRFDQNYEIADEDGEWWIFPKSTFSDWFEEAKEMPKLPIGASEAIIKKLDNELPDSSYWDRKRNEFKEWLDENTEQ